MFELSFVFVTVNPDMDSVAFGLTETPFADVAVAFVSFPDAGTVLHAVGPLTLVDFAVGVDVGTYAFGFSVYVLALVVTVVGK